MKSSFQQCDRFSGFSNIEISQLSCAANRLAGFYVVEGKKPVRSLETMVSDENFQKPIVEYISSFLWSLLNVLFMHESFTIFNAYLYMRHLCMVYLCDVFIAVILICIIGLSM